LRQAGETFRNHVLRDKLEGAERKLTEGAALSAALEGLLPSYAIGVLLTGERSGNLAKSLQDISSACEREAGAAIDTFISFLEPCLTLVIGAMLAWTVLAVLGPLYGSISVLGGRM
jgi:type IV pilus assembly protein PilC